MAERRMFAKTIVLSDEFLDMPLSTRCLYFTLGMFADDDGFVNSPKGIIRQCGASDDDMRLLIAKRFVLTFESGVIVIKHWRINNYLRNDRYKESLYQDEKALLQIKDNGSYTFGIPSMGIPSIGKDSIGKDSIGKDSIGMDADATTPTPLCDNVTQVSQNCHKDKDKDVKHSHGEYKHVKLTDKEFAKLETDFGTEIRDKAIKFLDEYIEEKAYKSKSHNLAIRRWVINAVKERDFKKPKGKQSGRDYNELERELLRR